MTNHLHLVALPAEADSLARTLSRTHFKYAQILNRLHNRSGHFWQDRYYSCALDQPHLLRAMAYIEMNPVRAKLARRPWDYSWSSARAHVEGIDPSGLLDMVAWQKLRTGDWKQTLSAASDKLFGETLELHLRRGRPLGSDSFIAKLEALAGKRLRPLAHGRPRKPKPLK
jgi:putative transposase